MKITAPINFILDNVQIIKHEDHYLSKVMIDDRYNHFFTDGIYQRIIQPISPFVRGHLDLTLKDAYEIALDNKQIRLLNKLYREYKKVL